MSMSKTNTGSAPTALPGAPGPALRARDAFDGVLSPRVARALEAALPDRARGRRWCRVHHLTADGSSLDTLLRRARGLAPTLLAVRCERGGVFGAFLTDAWWDAGLPLGVHAKSAKSAGFFGLGAAAFVFLCEDDDASPRTFSAVPGHPPQFLRVRAARTGGVAALELGVGGGGGGTSAMLLDEGLETCASGPCAAFASPPLTRSADDGRASRVLDVELWAWAETDAELVAGGSSRGADSSACIVGGGGVVRLRDELHSTYRDDPLCGRTADGGSTCAAEELCTGRESCS
jgi:hypothetical protein